MSFFKNVYDRSGKYLGQIEWWEHISELPGGDPSSPSNVSVLINGVPADLENPLNVACQVDSVVKSDLDLEQCEIAPGWLNVHDDTPATVDSLAFLFEKSKNQGIYFPSGSGFKTFKLVFKRTVQARIFGIGSDSGNFSNIRADLLGSGNAERGVLDLSEDDTKSTSLVYREIQREFNAVEVEFFTNDRITVTNLYIKNQYSEKKEDYILKWGVNPDIDSGGNEDIWEGGDLYVFTTIAQPYYISSSDPADIGKTVRCQTVGLRADGRYQKNVTDVLLDGQNPVLIPTVLTNQVASNTAFVLPGGPTIGTLYIHESDTLTGGVPNDPTKVRSIILPENQRTQQAVFTTYHFTETGRRIVDWEIYRAGGSAIRERSTSGLLKLYRSFFTGEGYQVLNTRGLRDTSRSEIEYGENTPEIIRPGDDVWLNASEITTNNVALEGGFTLRPVVV